MTQPETGVPGVPTGRQTGEETASDANRRFYDQVLPGQQDYWRLMAASRFRLDTLLDAIARRDPRSVVDLGCGGGQLLRLVRQRLPAAETAGVDLSEAQIEADRRDDPAGRYLAADLSQPSRFPEDWQGRFDVVVAMEVIEHLDRPELLLANARDLARPGGGVLLLSTQSGPISHSERRVGHRRHFSREEMSRLLEEAGWRVERVWNAGYPFHDWSKKVANLRPDWSMRRFSERPYGWFEKGVCLALRTLFRLNSKKRGAQLFAEASRPFA
ncbi:MAG: class I SAM-dependent methyltransferase [Bradymonadales bacterium]|nr:class I SAM-dependent methyltransferase [Bradymonadales bacterium]